LVPRTGEIGVRMALGALPGPVQGMIIRESLSIVLVGVVAGVAAAYAFYQIVTGML
jgi:ABC-type antimicrobial peptide transport system permease subunit